MLKTPSFLLLFYAPKSFHYSFSNGLFGKSHDYISQFSYTFLFVSLSFILSSFFFLRRVKYFLTPWVMETFLALLDVPSLLTTPTT